MSRLTLTKGRTGANTLTDYVKCSALVGYFGTTKPKSPVEGKIYLEEDKPITLYTVDDIASYGITDTLLTHHISEYFRVSGSGAVLWLLSVSEGDKSFKSLIESESVKKMIAQADGNIFNLGFAYLPEMSVAKVDGMPQGLMEAIQAAQALSDWTFSTNRPLCIGLEGAGYAGQAASVLNLRDLKISETEFNAPNVSVVIGQDWDFADSLKNEAQYYAAIGTLLGAMAKRPVSLNIGEVGTMPLTDATRGGWINAGLSNHVKVKDQEAELETLNTKGYILAEYYSGIAVFNDGHNCAREVIDADGNMSESSMALARTNCKVFRELYEAYLPKIKSSPPLDRTGKLTTGMIRYYEGFGDDVFARMSAAGEISAGETTVDPDSDLVTGNKSLDVSYDWMPIGCIGRINGVINIKRSLV